MNPSSGFTLLEMMVAISVFALLTISGYQVIDNVSRANLVSETHSKSIIHINQAMQIINHDLIQLIPRSLRGVTGVTEPALLAGSGIADSQSIGIRFVRGGLTNPQMFLPRSQLLRVAYRLYDGRLERLTWPVIDAPQSIKPHTQTLISNTKNLQIRFYDGEKWLAEWGKGDSLPNAVQLRIEVEALGYIERIWLIKGPEVVVEDFRDEGV